MQIKQRGKSDKASWNILIKWNLDGWFLFLSAVVLERGEVMMSLCTSIIGVAPVKSRLKMLTLSKLMESRCLPTTQWGNKWLCWCFQLPFLSSLITKIFSQADPIQSHSGPFYVWRMRHLIHTCACWCSPLTGQGLSSFLFHHHNPPTHLSCNPAGAMSSFQVRLMFRECVFSITLDSVLWLVKAFPPLYSTTTTHYPAHWCNVIIAFAG